MNRPDAAFSGPMRYTDGGRGGGAVWGEPPGAAWGSSRRYGRKGLCLLYTKRAVGGFTSLCALNTRRNGRRSRRRCMALCRDDAVGGGGTGYRGCDRLPRRRSPWVYLEAPELCPRVDAGQPALAHTRLFWTPARIVMSVLGPLDCSQAF